MIVLLFAHRDNALIYKVKIPMLENYYGVKIGKVPCFFLCVYLCIFFFFKIFGNFQYDFLCGEPSLDNMEHNENRISEFGWPVHALLSRIQTYTLLYILEDISYICIGFIWDALKFNEWKKKTQSNRKFQLIIWYEVI